MLDAQAASATSAGGAGGTSTSTLPSGSTTPDTTPPVIRIIGANPTTVPIGSAYSDLGATVSDNVNMNLGYTVSVDGATSTSPDQLTLDTSVAASHTLLFSATDQAGNIGTATRTVIVGGGATTTAPVPGADATSTPLVTGSTSTGSSSTATPDATSSATSTTP
jgi:hypothetical protein